MEKKQHQKSYNQGQFILDSQISLRFLPFALCPMPYAFGFGSDHTIRLNNFSSSLTDHKAQNKKSPES